MHETFAICVVKSGDLVTLFSIKTQVIIELLQYKSNTFFTPCNVYTLFMT